MIMRHGLPRSRVKFDVLRRGLCTVEPRNHERHRIHAESRLTVPESIFPAFPELSIASLWKRAMVTGRVSGNAESTERREDHQRESSRRASGCILCLPWFRGSWFHGSAVPWCKGLLAGVTIALFTTEARKAPERREDQQRIVTTCLRVYSVFLSVVPWFRGSVVQRTPRRSDHRPFHHGSAESPERREDHQRESSRRASGRILCLPWFRGSVVRGSVVPRFRGERTPRRSDHRPFHHGSAESTERREDHQRRIVKTLPPGVFCVFRGSAVSWCKGLLAGVTIALFTTEARKARNAGKITRESSKRASGCILVFRGSVVPRFRGAKDSSPE